MTRFAIRTSSVVLAVVALLAPSVAADVRVEVVPELCAGLSQAEKPIVAVMDFKVKVDVTGDVGGGMASMLSNALLNSGCFTVVERARLDDVMNEQAFGMSGAVEEPTAASAGRIKGARYQVMGEITEFSDNASGVSGAARTIGRLFRRNRASAAAGAVDVRNAHVGFIIKIVDTSSAVVLGSQSFEKKRTTAGLAASSWWGSSAFAGAGQISKAMADAIEEGIIEATRYLAPYRDQMVDQTQQARAAGGGVSAPKPGECGLINSAGSMRVMVMIPEEHIMGTWGSYAEGRAFKFDEYEGNRQAAPSGSSANAAMNAAQRMIRPPDPAGETEIIKRFLEQGFTVVDPKQYESLRETERYLSVNDDVAYASEVGRQFGADIVITGEAFSEFSKNINGMMSARARVEAKAIEARTARIIAADGLHAGHVDVSEVIAGKGALRSAGGKVADYFLAQVCAKDAAYFGGAASGAAPVSGVAGGVTELIVTGVDFMASSKLQKALEALGSVNAVEKKSFRDGTVNFHVTHEGSADELAEAMIGNAGSFPLEIVSLDGRKIAARMK